VPTVDQVSRERLLGANVRFPFSIRSAEANQWISSRVDPEIAAGLPFVGTGDTNGGDFRELIWTDSSGPFFSPTLWSARSSDGLELIATLDFDSDGMAELAWHDGIDVALWSASDTF